MSIPQNIYNETRTMINLFVQNVAIFINLLICQTLKIITEP